MLKISLQWVLIAWQGRAQTPQPHALWLLPAFRWLLLPPPMLCDPAHGSCPLHTSVSMEMGFLPPEMPSPPAPLLFYLVNSYLFFNDSPLKTPLLCEVFLYILHPESNSSFLCVSRALLAAPSCSGPRFWTGHLNSPHHLVCRPRLENLTPSFLPCPMKAFSQVTTGSLTNSNSNEYPVLLFSEAV